MGGWVANLMGGGGPLVQSAVDANVHSGAVQGNAAIHSFIVHELDNVAFYIHRHLSRETFAGLFSWLKIFQLISL